MQVLWTFGLLYASDKTIQAHAYVFNNVHGLFILLINCVIGQRPIKYEYIGAALIIVGCVCMVIDPSAMRADGTQPSVFPALIDFFSAFFGALYFLMNTRNVKALPVCFLIFTLNLFCFLINALLAKLVFDFEVKIFSFDVHRGCLGFLNPEIALFTIFPYGILTALFGSAGYVLCLLFYSPMVAANAYLLEPFIAQALGYFLGLDALPGLLTLVGTIFAVSGIVFL